MQTKKFILVLTVAALFAVSLVSCKKDKGTAAITSDQLVGKWNATIQLNVLQNVHIELKKGGSMEFDVAPYDGVADVIGLWSLEGNTFKGTVAGSGNPEYYRMDATVSRTDALSGKFTLTDPANPEPGTFEMSR